MKFNKKLYTMALGTIAFGGLLASCTNDLNEPTFGPVEGNGSVNLVHTPDVYAWSGAEDLGNNTRSFGTRATYGTREYYKTYDGDFPAEYKDKIPAEIQQNEKTYILNYIKDHSNEGGFTCNLTDYFVQNVGGSYDSYSVTYINGEANNLNPDGSYKDETNTRTATFTGSNQMDYFCLDGEHVPDYNANYGPTALCLNWPVTNPTYHDSWGTEDNTKENHYKFFIIEYPVGSGTYNYYLGFDYATKKWDNGDIDYNGDGVYNDWVIKLTPADGNQSGGDNPDDDTNDNPGTGGDTGNNPENPGNGDNGNNGGDNNGNVTIEDKRHFGEVEVNLSVNDVHINDGGGQKYDYADLWTKLSIHVRKGTDVKVVLPVPAKYMVESDDFAIFQKHELGGGVTSGDMAPDIDPTQRIQSMTYTITDPESERSWPVKLIIEFKNVNEDSNYPDGCIIVSTTGIDKNLIDYLWKKNGDGINFEVWNYFQTDNLGSNQPVIGDDGLLYSSDLTHSRLQKILNGETEYGKSTIQFINEAPDFYINAFGFEWTASGLQGTHNSNINPWDCTVIPVDTATFPSAEPYYCYHLNSTPWNIIWVNNNVEKKGAAYEAHVNYFYHPTEGYIRVKFPWEQQ